MRAFRLYSGEFWRGLLWVALLLLFACFVLSNSKAAEARELHHHHRHWRAHHRVHHHPRAVRHGHPRRYAGPIKTYESSAGPIVVASSFAPKILGFIRDLRREGYLPHHVGCFARGGHVAHSLHYSGEACDFDQRGWGLTPSIMHHVGALVRKWGLRDGCSFGDCGHIDAGIGPLPRNPFFPRNWFAKRATEGKSL